jgi:hypothetical protein
VWPFRKKDQNTIHVRFFDAASGRLLGESSIPAERLPQSFEADTTMHMQDGDWRVEEARPMTAIEFKRTGQLTLVLRQVKIETVDPGEILYSLPTIADALPGIIPGSSKLGRSVIEIHEDDWRQSEWVHISFMEQIESELEQIRQIHETARDGPGFGRIHVRNAIPNPLSPAKIQLDELTQALGPRAAWLDGVSFDGIAGIVTYSFAVRLISSIELYGTRDDRGSIHAICCGNIKPNNIPQPDIDNLASWAMKNELVLVDWVKMQTVSPMSIDYASYFACGQV